MRILGLNGFERDAAKNIFAHIARTNSLVVRLHLRPLTYPSVLFYVLSTAGVSSGRSGFKERYSSKQAETDKPLGFDSLSPTKLIIKLWK